MCLKLIQWLTESVKVKAAKTCINIRFIPQAGHSWSFKGEFRGLEIKNLIFRRQNPIRQDFILYKRLYIYYYNNNQNNIRVCWWLEIEKQISNQAHCWSHHNYALCWKIIAMTHCEVRRSKTSILSLRIKNFVLGLKVTNYWK